MTYPRQFNTAGPSKADKHYQIDPLKRINHLEIEALIRDERYFVLHAPRQTGKTTSLRALVQYLNASGHYRAVYANIEGAQTARHDEALGIGIEYMWELLNGICGTGSLSEAGFVSFMKDTIFLPTVFIDLTCQSNVKTSSFNTQVKAHGTREKAKGNRFSGGDRNVISRVIFCDSVPANEAVRINAFLQNYPAISNFS